MKPTLQYLDKPTARAASERQYRDLRAHTPATDHLYQAGPLANNRCFGSRGASFRGISDHYFKTEAPHIFAGEATFFAIIAMTAALPILNGASVLLHFVRSLAL